MSEIKKIVYLVDGEEEFVEPMIFKRLYKAGDSLIHDYITFIVKDVYVENDIQYVNCTKITRA